MNHSNDLYPIDIGGGLIASIRELAELIKEVVGFRGDLRLDTTRPKCMPLKLLDSSALREMGWKPTTAILAGLSRTHKWSQQNQRGGSFVQAEF